MSDTDKNTDHIFFTQHDTLLCMRVREVRGTIDDADHNQWHASVWAIHDEGTPQENLGEYTSRDKATAINGAWQQVWRKLPNPNAETLGDPAMQVVGYKLVNLPHIIGTMQNVICTIPPALKEQTDLFDGGKIVTTRQGDRWSSLVYNKAGGLEAGDSDEDFDTARRKAYKAYLEVAGNAEKDLEACEKHAADIEEEKRIARHVGDWAWVRPEEPENVFLKQVLYGLPEEVILDLTGKSGIKSNEGIERFKHAVLSYLCRSMGRLIAERRYENGCYCDYKHVTIRCDDMWVTSTYLNGELLDESDSIDKELSKLLGVYSADCLMFLESDDRLKALIEADEKEMDDTLVGNLADIRGQLLSVQDKVRGLPDSVERAQTRAECAEEKAYQVHGIVEKLSERVVALEAHASRLTTIYPNMEAREVEMANDIARVNQRFDNEEEKLCGVLKEIDEKVRGLAARIEAQESIGYKDRVNNLEHKVPRHGDDIAKLRKDTDAQAQWLHATDAHITDLSEKCRELKKQIDGIAGALLDKKPEEDKGWSFTPAAQAIAEEDATGNVELLDTPYPADREDIVEGHQSHAALGDSYIICEFKDGWWVCRVYRRDNDELIGNASSKHRPSTRSLALARAACKCLSDEDCEESHSAAPSRTSPAGA